MQFYSLHIESVSAAHIRNSSIKRRFSWYRREIRYTVLLSQIGVGDGIFIYLYFPFKSIDIIFQTLEVHRDQTRSSYFLTMQKIFVKEEHKESWNYGIITFPSSAKESRHHCSPKILKNFIKKIHFLELWLFSNKN